MLDLHAITETKTAITAGGVTISRRSMSDQMTRLTDLVVAELESAGATLLALPTTGFSTGIRVGGLDFVRDAVEAYGWGDMPIRPAAPSSNAISRMDIALTWLSLIPPASLVLRKVVGARSLVHPITGRHLFQWRKIGLMLSTDHKQVQRWHGEGIALIVAALLAEK